MIVQIISVLCLVAIIGALFFSKSEREVKAIRVKYHYPDLPRLEKIKQGDWIDLYTAETAVIKQNELVVIGLGVSMELPEGYEAHIVPRSSTYKKWKLICANSFGVIDNSYCGDEDVWGFPAIYNGKLPQIIVPAHTRLCQFRIERKQPVLDFVEVEKLGNKNRGGFGSTGVSKN